MSDASCPVFLNRPGAVWCWSAADEWRRRNYPLCSPCGARVSVVAPEIRAELRDASVELPVSDFEPADLDGCWFVVAAAPAQVNRPAAADAQARRVFVNAVDDAAHASTCLGGVLRRDGVTVAVSTGGQAPALSGLLHHGLAALRLKSWVGSAHAQRAAWLAFGVPLAERRPLLLEALNRIPAARAAGRVS